MALQQKHPANSGDQKIPLLIRLNGIGTDREAAGRLGVVGADKQRMERSTDRIIFYHTLAGPHPQIIEPVFMKRVNVIMRKGK